MASCERYEFDGFSLDADERQLIVGGAQLALPPKTFDVLLALLRRAGHLVTKQELLGCVWPDTFVDEGILSVHVSALRKVLNHAAGCAIETVSRSGYRFVGEVRRLTAVSDGEASLVVLPFANSSVDPDNDYFSDGLTEEVIYALGQCPNLRIIARTSAFALKHQARDVREIARSLGVTHVVEGSVRRVADHLRVTVQLIRASDGTRVRSEQYERTMAGMVGLENEIARTIRDAMDVTVEPVREVRPPTANIAAYESLLKGRYYLSKMTPASMARARGCLEAAIVLDRQCVPAYCALARYFVLLAVNNHQPAREVMPLARKAAEQALAIDPNRAEAHSALAQVAALFEFDWVEAEHHQTQAMTFKPVSPLVRMAYARHLLITDRPADGAEQARRALEEDPLDLVGRLFLAHCLQAAGEIAAAAAQIKQVLELDDSFWLAHLVNGLNQLGQGLGADALASAEHAYALAPWNLRVIGLLAAALKRTGQIARANELLRHLDDAAIYGVPTARMLFHGACLELDEGITWAEAALEQRDAVAVIHLLGPDRHTWNAGTGWPRLARAMNR